MIQLTDRVRITNQNDRSLVRMAMSPMPPLAPMDAPLQKSPPITPEQRICREEYVFGVRRVILCYTGLPFGVDGMVITSRLSHVVRCHRASPSAYAKHTKRCREQVFHDV